MLIMIRKEVKFLHRCHIKVLNNKYNHINQKHHHKQAKEITGIIKGVARINDNILKEGDLILINPNESAEFEAIEDVITIVYKSKSVTNDKFIDE